MWALDYKQRLRWRDFKIAPHPQQPSRKFPTLLLTGFPDSRAPEHFREVLWKSATAKTSVLKTPLSWLLNSKERPFPIGGSVPLTGHRFSWLGEAMPAQTSCAHSHSTCQLSSAVWPLCSPMTSLQQHAPGMVGASFRKAKKAPTHTDLSNYICPNPQLPKLLAI